MSTIHQRGMARVEANLTPMIDVTFLLIIFFVLVSQIVEVEAVSMDLPAPADPVSAPPSEEQRAVINVLPGDGGRAGGYRVGSRLFAAGPEGLAGLTAHLRDLYTLTPGMGVNLRADRGTRYEGVQPVMQAVADAAAEAGGQAITPRLNLVVVREEP